ncbi:MAG: LysM peptidoglycan-binding domain-containing protein [Ardenticatenaceae bacterium]|nr:LysM peptidoglycan-binding domain-containing protein [Anaerolineales bacterium]MCB8921753.1 LysM peptidoglycan-binding domain-containing protein [Ardenticatenaceae bacterium]MCB8990728.1 LysM peptidoglycan-binding domain-containing protein [Ardenticatenaceae bacterium]
MKRKITISVLISLCLLIFLHGSQPSVSAQDPASQVLQLVNQVRANYGLSGFTYNARLAAAAQEQANWMAVNTQYVHNHGGSTPQTRAESAGYVGYVSENIVGGTNLTPQQGVVWWQNSPVHFNTMISTRYVEAGVGVAYGPDQNFYVLVVGKPSDSPPVQQVAQPETAPAYVAPIILAQPGEDGSIVHKVLTGQTLWAIAARYEVPLQTLLLYNNLAEDAFLQPGDELLIQLAEGQSPPPTPTPPATHVVREGETAWTIAARYRLSLDEILWLNGLSEDSILRPGDEVVIRLLPGQSPPPTPTPQLTHIVHSGDTLWGVALAYGLSLDQLLAWNGLDQNALIVEGQALYIRATETPVPTPTPTFTPMPPDTPVPTATAVLNAVIASSTRTTPVAPPAVEGTAVAQTPAAFSEAKPGGFGSAMLIGSVIAAVGLLALAVVAVVAIRRAL